MAGQMLQCSVKEPHWNGGEGGKMPPPVLEEQIPCPMPSAARRGRGLVLIEARLVLFSGKRGQGEQPSETPLGPFVPRLHSVPSNARRQGQSQASRLCLSEGELAGRRSRGLLQRLCVGADGGGHSSGAGRVGKPHLLQGHSRSGHSLDLK
ncbi:UNVERIFIED_CONTAM: hypothetical protein K2H54_008933 [Gekko kuhli]